MSHLEHRNCIRLASRVPQEIFNQEEAAERTQVTCSKPFSSQLYALRQANIRAGLAFVIMPSPFVNGSPIENFCQAGCLAWLTIRFMNQHVR
jgi:N6-adenosine-specific RNA methylase IME4